jgi:hypothetical protein
VYTVAGHTQRNPEFGTSVRTPTYVSTKHIKIEEGFDLNSDHSPIYLTVSDKIVTKDQNPAQTNKETGIISAIY